MTANTSSHWRIDLSQDCLLHQHEDAFGNITHTLHAPTARSTNSAISVDGEVETQDTNGFVRGAVERFPPSLYLRETALTLPDAAIVEFAEDARAEAWRRRRHAGGAAPAAGRRCTARSHSTPSRPQTATTAAEAFELKRGVCQDLSHIFIAAARQLGIPARYIGGHFHRADGVTAQDAGHAWAEAYVEPTRLGRLRSDQRHLRRPTRMCGSRRASTTSAPRRCAAPAIGGGGETLKVAVNVDAGEPAIAEALPSPTPSPL